jgi:hypothetical protein
MTSPNHRPRVDTWGGEGAPTPHRVGFTHRSFFPFTQLALKPEVAGPTHGVGEYSGGLHFSAGHRCKTERPEAQGRGGGLCRVTARGKCRSQYDERGGYCQTRGVYHMPRSGVGNPATGPLPGPEPAECCRRVG